MPLEQLNTGQPQREPSGPIQLSARHHFNITLKQQSGVLTIELGRVAVHRLFDHSVAGVTNLSWERPRNG